jgi:hypothetical protein
MMVIPKPCFEFTFGPVRLQEAITIGLAAGEAGQALGLPPLHHRPFLVDKFPAGLPTLNFHADLITREYLHLTQDLLDQIETTRHVEQARGAGIQRLPGILVELVALRERENQVGGGTPGRGFDIELLGKALRSKRLQKRDAVLRTVLIAMSIGVNTKNRGRDVVRTVYLSRPTSGYGIDPLQAGAACRPVEHLEFWDLPAELARWGVAVLL